VQAAPQQPGAAVRQERGLVVAEEEQQQARPEAVAPEEQRRPLESLSYAAFPVVFPVVFQRALPVEREPERTVSLAAAPLLSPPALAKNMPKPTIRSGRVADKV
jgi:hypothetical protein